MAARTETAVPLEQIPIQRRAVGTVARELDLTASALAGRGVQRLNTVAAPSLLSNADQLRMTVAMTVFQAIQREAATQKE